MVNNNKSCKQHNTLFLFLEAVIDKEALHVLCMLVLDAKEHNAGFCYWHLSLISSNFLMTNLQAIFVWGFFLGFFFFFPPSWSIC